MKIRTFGCTGETGLLLTQHALEQGHTVYALARTPSKLKLPGVDKETLKNLHIVKGDISNQAAVEEVVSKSEVVIETLGASINRKTSIKQDGARAIIAAMKKHNKTRFVAVTSHMVHKDYEIHNPWLGRAIIDLLLNHIKDDLKAMEDVILAEGDWLNYTILEPPQLVPAPPTGKVNISVSYPDGVKQVTFADLALTMLDTAVRGKYSRQAVGMNGTVPLKVGWKESEKARVLVWDNFVSRLLVPGVKLGLVVAAVAAAYLASKRVQVTAAP